VTGKIIIRHHDSFSSGIIVTRRTRAVTVTVTDPLYVLAVVRDVPVRNLKKGARMQGPPGGRGGPPREPLSGHHQQTQYPLKHIISGDIIYFNMF
jgi:hypothetical protein